jgi:hypothetical protein
MAALAWLVAPALADRLSGEGNLPLSKALLLCITVGLIWQFVLVVILIWREQRTLRWSTIRDALWLRSPRSPRSGRRGGRVWLVVIPLMVAYAAVPFLFPSPPSPSPATSEVVGSGMDLSHRRSTGTLRRSSPQPQAPSSPNPVRYSMGRSPVQPFARMIGWWAGRRWSLGWGQGR